MPEAPEQASESAVDLKARYGRGSSPTTRLGMVIGGLVIAALLVWVVWMVWLQSNPKVTSSLDSWQVVSPNEVSLAVTVNMRDGAQDVSCHVEVYASDHSTVAEQDVTPIDGRQTLTLQTLSEGTSVDWQGCTATGQNNAQ